MLSTSRTLAAVVLSLLLLFPVIPLSAQDEQVNSPAAGTILIEQKSDIDAVGVWTLIQPNQESFQRSDAVLDVPNMTPGQYTFLSTPPEGTTARIDLYLGDDIIKTENHPQITFELKDTMTLRLVITYSLTIFGKIGVTSDPFGVPFDLVGPNGMKKT